MSPPSRTARPPQAPRLTRCAVLLLAALATVAAVMVPAQIGAVPSDVSGVSLDPPVTRLPDGAGAVTFRVGADAAQDLVVTFTLLGVAVDGQGRATATREPLTGGSVGLATVRLRPGEQVVVPVRIDGDAPAVLVATVEPAAPGSDPVGTGGEVVRVESLVLPGAPDPAPVVRVDEDGSVTVRATTPTLVSLRVSGVEAQLLPSRLLLPDGALRTAVAPAGWPRVTTAVVTTETGVVVRDATDPSGAMIVASLVLLLAVAALVATRRAVRPAR